MDQKYSDDSFLGRWINNDLTEEEMAAFKKSREYREYQKIISGMEHFGMPELDRLKSYGTFKEKSATPKKQKVKKLIPNWAYAAASVILILGAVYFFGGSKTYSTDFGEQLAFELPDGSEVKLNSKSSLQYNSWSWDKNRRVKLKGEAYFKVEKGSDFEVMSSGGKVSVLGTKFNVRNRDNSFEVRCFEGKVSVLLRGEENILNQGDAIRSVKDQSVENWKFNSEHPDWLHKESSFRSAPLIQVLEELESQFNINFNISSIDVQQRFTGSFSHDNRDVALETVFAPLEINYTFGKDNVVSLSK